MSECHGTARLVFQNVFLCVCLSVTYFQAFYWSKVGTLYHGGWDWRGPHYIFGAAGKEYKEGNIELSLATLRLFILLSYEKLRYVCLTEKCHIPIYQNICQPSPLNFPPPCVTKVTDIYSQPKSSQWWLYWRLLGSTSTCKKPPLLFEWNKNPLLVFLSFLFRLIAHNLGKDKNINLYIPK